MVAKGLLRVFQRAGYDEVADGPTVDGSRPLISPFHGDSEPQNGVFASGCTGQAFIDPGTRVKIDNVAIFSPWRYR